MIPPLGADQSENGTVPGAPFLVASNCFRLPIARWSAGSYAPFVKGERAASASADGKRGAS